MSIPSIVIVDYGLGNLGSIANMLRKIGVSSVVTDDLDTIAEAPRLILPGVGAFGKGMASLVSRGLVDVLNQQVLGHRVPVLGICLGAQLMTQGSEEGSEPGLGWVDASTVRFAPDKLGPRQKVPHMGWTNVKAMKPHSLLDSMYEDPRFYFVHSYHFQLDREEDVLTYSLYGYDFVSSFAVDNIVGVQFHPEKSHKYGMRLLSAFAEFEPSGAAIPGTL